jgi:hypothetical protein
MKLTSLLLAALLSAVPAIASADGDTPPDHASPSVCVVILGLMRQAIAEGKATGDAEAMAAASETFREKAVALNEGEDGAAQMIGSSVSFYDELTPAELSTSADLCIDAEDEEFSADE